MFKTADSRPMGIGKKYQAIYDIPLLGKWIVDLIRICCISWKNKIWYYKLIKMQMFNTSAIFGFMKAWLSLAL